MIGNLMHNALPWTGSSRSNPSSSVATKGSLTAAARGRGRGAGGDRPAHRRAGRAAGRQAAAAHHAAHHAHARRQRLPRRLPAPAGRPGQCRGQRQRRRREGQRPPACHGAGRLRPPPRGAAGAALPRPAPRRERVAEPVSDRVVDIVNEGFDCAVRVGDLPDSSLVSVRLADNRRLCVAAPAYLQRAGTPQTPADLSRHECLTLSSDASQTRGWAFMVDGAVTHLRPSGRLDCSDGQVLHDWCLAGLGSPGAAPGRWSARWQRPAGGGAGRVRGAAERHLRGVPAAQAPAAAGAAVDRLKHSSAI
jgi:hypothetical protein